MVHALAFSVFFPPGLVLLLLIALYCGVVKFVDHTGPAVKCVRPGSYGLRFVSRKRNGQNGLDELRREISERSVPTRVHRPNWRVAEIEQ
jgi:hypothetical protein